MVSIVGVMGAIDLLGAEGMAGAMGVADTVCGPRWTYVVDDKR